MRLSDDRLSAVLAAQAAAPNVPRGLNRGFSLRAVRRRRRRRSLDAICRSRSFSISAAHRLGLSRCPSVICGGESRVVGHCNEVIVAAPRTRPVSSSTIIPAGRAGSAQAVGSPVKPAMRGLESRPKIFWYSGRERRSCPGRPGFVGSHSGATVRTVVVPCGRASSG